jgi:hypothetical protein
LINKFNSGALYNQILANLTTNTNPANPTTLAAQDLTPVNRNIQRNDYKQPNSYQGPRDVRFGFKFIF